MDTVKVAKDYFLSSQSNLLLPNRDYGSRKFVQVTGLPKVPANLPDLPRPSVPFRNSTDTPGKGKYLPNSHSDSNLLRRYKEETAAGSEGLEDLRKPSDVMKSSE